MMKKNLIGLRFGNLVVCDFAPNHPTTHRVCWKCLCDCGVEIIVQANNLQSGNTTSCGCMGSRHFIVENSQKSSGKVDKNGKIRYYNHHSIPDTHPLYLKWIDMKKRCYDKASNRYSRYGARGIKVCDEWIHDFKTFYEWSYANGYKQGLTIDRIDNDGPYSPDNCRYVTNLEQCTNRSTNVWLTYNGEKHTISQWSKITGLHPTTIRSRLLKNWPVEKILTTDGTKYKVIL